MTILWHAHPASRFIDGWPLGNGHLGMTLPGGIGSERIIINEAGAWSGSPDDHDRTGAAAHLPAIREHLRHGRYREAQALVHAAFTCAGPGSGVANGADLPFGSYQVLGELDLAWPDLDPSAVVGYRHQLDTATGRVVTTFTCAGEGHRRESLVSHPDRIAATRLQAPVGTRLALRLSRSAAAATARSARDGSDLRLTVDFADGRGGSNVRACVVLRILPGDAQVEAGDDGLVLRHGASPVVLLLAAVTDIRSFAGRRSDDPAATCAADLAAAAAAGWDAIAAAQAADHGALSGGCALELSGGRDDLPTSERLIAAAAGTPDPGLEAQLFAFGRHLLISSSRPGGLPANLQGIWSEDVQTPWNGDWHLNINVQMNYWPAAITGLAALETPLFDLIDGLVEPGRRTAAAYYGARGWVAHVITNPWGFTSPGEQASWGSTVTGSAWLCTHLIEHWRFTRDRAQLMRRWPALAGAVRFALDALVEDVDGRLITSPSNSPENGFVLPDGSGVHTCAGPTIDSQIIRELLAGAIVVGGVLGRDADLLAEAAAALPRLPATRVGPDGAIAEWRHDLPATDPHHRHVSHLWGLYPGHEIDPARTPGLAAGARRSLDLRGEDSTGWSLAWRAGFWARLGDGARAARQLALLQRPCGVPGGTYNGSGLYPNLFCAHPPFQIDGNLGVVAAMCEMLLRSRWSGDPSEAPGLELLPALPPHWRDGMIRGLRARGAATVDLAWRDGRLHEAWIVADQDGPWRLRHGDGTERSLDLTAGERQPIAFPTPRTTP